MKFTFLDRQQNDVFRCLPERRRKADFLIADPDSCLDCRFILRIPGSFQMHLISLIDMFFRRKQIMRQSAVVGDQKQAFGINIQPSDWK